MMMICKVKICLYAFFGPDVQDILLNLEVNKLYCFTIVKNLN